MKYKYHSFATETPVAIPMIQRDYVQGADVNSKKRDVFLEKILKALSDPQKDFEVDFVYGSTADNRSFVPVDGQQRLTTLMLLGWLLNQRSGRKYTSIIPRLNYHTRPSTEQFCEHLRKYDLPEGCNSISQHLRTEPGWFSRRWEEDASIMSMLEFLDKADTLLSEHYQEHIPEMAETFFKDNPVTFEYLDMKALNLSDDLYIKMNARGKQLTVFENWKAGFEDFLKKHFFKTPYGHGKIPELDENPSIYDYFIYAIEHEWCDMLWKIALEQWKGLSEEKKREVSYPRTDDLFMNLFNYVSQMLYFTSLPDAEKLVKGKDITLRQMYEANEEKILNELYMDEKNVVTLFRILDLFVVLNKKWERCEGFFDLLFTNTFDSSSKKVNLYKDTQINLFERCIWNRLDAVTEVLLWGLLCYLLEYPTVEYDGDVASDSLLDYVRTLVGMLRGRNQRLINGLAVRADVNQVDYHNFGVAIKELIADPDVHKALTQSKSSLLAAERKKEEHFRKPSYKEIVALSGHPALYYDFSSLYKSMEDVDSGITTADGYINRFKELMKLENVNRIKELTSHGFRGITVQDSYYFYGADDKWDFIFTSRSKHFEEVLTAWMRKESNKVFNKNEIAYYIENYQEFINAVYNPVRNQPHYYFYRKLTDNFTAWALKTYSSRPIMGYNTCPYAFTVYRKWRGKNIALWPESEYSSHGVLYVGRPNVKNGDLVMECVETGWKISILDQEGGVAQAFKARYFSGDTLKDSEGQFNFNEEILLDLPVADRITTAIDFLKTLE